ncbi:MAG: nucleotidyltransferase family protein [Paracoccaceae bacterium]|jgi:molybdenum cofactor cytidylyltransferase
MSLAIVILAAGASSRMRGRDKLFEVVEGTPILTRLVHFAQVCGDVYVTLPDPNHPRHNLLTGTKAVPIYVPDAADGMSASIKRAFAAVMETSATGMMILTGDLPDLTEAHFTQVCAEWAKDKTRYVQAKDRDGKPGHPVIIPKSGWADIETLQGDIGLRNILREKRMKYVSFKDYGPTLDLDTPEAWDNWRAAR